MQAWRALYTKQLQKKRKTYADGFVVMCPSGTVVLQDDSGKELAVASGPLPAGEGWGSCEGVAVFEGFLVNGDGECPPEELPNGGPAASNNMPPDGGSNPGFGCPQAPQPASQSNAFMQPAFKCTAFSVAAGSGGGACIPVVQRQQPQQQAMPHERPLLCQAQQQPVQQWRPPQQQEQPQQQWQPGHQARLAGEPTRSLPCGGFRQDADILSILSGGVASNSDSSMGPVGPDKQQAPRSAADMQAAVDQGPTTSTHSSFGGLYQYNPDCRAPVMVRHGAAHRSSGQGTSNGPRPTARQPQHLPDQQQQQQSALHHPWPQQPQPWSQLHAPQQQQQQQQQQQHPQQGAWTDRPVNQSAVTTTARAPQSASLGSNNNQGPPAVGPFSTPHARATVSAVAAGAGAGSARFPSTPATPDVAQPRPGWGATPTSIVAAASLSKAAVGGASNQQQQPMQQQQQQRQPLQHMELNCFAVDRASACQVSTAGAVALTVAHPPEAAQPLVSAAPPAQSKWRPPISSIPAVSSSTSQSNSNGAAGGLSLCFPSPDAATAPPKRTVMIPTQLPNGAAYQAAMSSALVEEINLRLAEHARQFYTLAQQADAMGAHGHPQQGQAKPPMQQQQQQGRHGGSGSGQNAAEPLARLQAACRRVGIAYHPGSTLKMWRDISSFYFSGGRGGGRGSWGGTGGKKKGRGGKKGQAGGGSDDEDEEREVQEDGPQTSWHLILGGNVDRRKHRKHELWIIGSQPLLTTTQRGHWVALARSTWHGPNQDGKLQVEWLSVPPPNLGRSTPVTALLGPDVATDVQVLTLISSMQQMGLGAAGTSAAPQQWALLQELLRPPPAPQQQQQQRGGEYGNTEQGAGVDVRQEGGRAALPQLDDASAAAVVSIAARFRLNDAQEKVAQHVASWLPALRKAAVKGGEAARRPALAKPAIKQHKGSKAKEGGESAVTSNDGQGAGGNQEERCSQPPICLVHGPFGSGKSTLLVALIHLLTIAWSSSGDGNEPKRFKQQAAGDQQQQQPGKLPGVRSKKGSGSGVRVLVASHTNVAVDNVLMGLADSGFSDMLRVGSLARMAKRLLGFSLHVGDDSKDAVAQLQAMLPEARGRDAELIRQEIAQLQAGAERGRRRRLGSAAVVGVTCCAALQAALEGQTFDVVVLDEASQMTEPTSLIPLLRSRCRYLIAAGDPLQLPPVIANPSALTPPPAAAPAGVRPGSSAPAPPAGGSLLRPLFVRLTQLGHEPHLLRWQHRCHPALSATPNRCFYGGRLMDGVTPQQRSPLLPGLPPLMFCDLMGSVAQRSFGGSSSNRMEAQLVVRVVGALLRIVNAVGSEGGSRDDSSRDEEDGLEQEGARGGQGNGGAYVSSGEEEDEQEEDDDWESDDGAGGSKRARRRSAPGSSASKRRRKQGGDAAAASQPTRAKPSPLAGQQLGVICFFRAQVDLIRQLLAADGAPGAADVQVATVDSFQGAEREMIVLATTSTQPGDFCGDPCRLNVALTRARRHLIVMGAGGALCRSSEVFRQLVDGCKAAQGAYLPGSSILGLPALRGDGGASGVQQEQGKNPVGTGLQQGGAGRWLPQKQQQQQPQQLPQQTWAGGQAQPSSLMPSPVLRQQQQGEDDSQRQEGGMPDLSVDDGAYGDMVDNGLEACGAQEQSLGLAAAVALGVGEGAAGEESKRSSGSGGSSGRLGLGMTCTGAPSGGQDAALGDDEASMWRVLHGRTCDASGASPREGDQDAGGDFELGVIGQAAATVAVVAAVTTKPVGHIDQSAAAGEVPSFSDGAGCCDDDFEGVAAGVIEGQDGACNMAVSIALGQDVEQGKTAFGMMDEDDDDW